MIKLVAKKKLRYPRGPDGREYQRGDTFEVLSERDKKALLLVRVAQEEPMPPLRVAEPGPARRTAALTPTDGLEDRPKRRGRPPKNPVVDVPSEADADDLTYRRRDMKAEDSN